MAKYTGAVCRLCRREGQKLFLKGERCYSKSCALERRAYAPGQHGQGRKKVSEYGRQLRTKQYAKRYYGVLEGQFRRYFAKAEKMQGQTGENLITLLESRLDNVAYRLGYGTSRAQARQLVTKEAIYAEAKRRAEEMAMQAQNRVTQIQKAGNSYMDESLRQTEEVIAKALSDVRETRMKFRTITEAQEQRSNPSVDVEV